MLFPNLISLPAKPEAHAHEKSFTRSVHVPPFLHGSGEQSLMLVSHVLPKVIRKHFIVYIEHIHIKNPQIKYPIALAHSLS